MKNYHLLILNNIFLLERLFFILENTSSLNEIITLSKSIREENDLSLYSRRIFNLLFIK